MKKSSEPPLIHWWDWLSVTLLFLLLQTTAARLVITSWTPYLHLVQTFTTMGFAIGVSLGYSTLAQRTARWLSFGYMTVMLPLVWTSVIDKQVKVEEQLLSVAGRLLFSISEFFSRRPVEDPLFFVSIMSLAFWLISASAGYRLIRHQNFLAIILPCAVGILVLQNYDNAVSGRLLILGFFALLALFLLGRLKFLQDQKHWRDKRVFLSPENGIDLSSGMAIAATLIIITAWSIPASFIRIESVRRAWNQIIRPWNDFTDRIENAVSALDSPSGGRPGEFFGTELALGLGFPLSDTLMFTVKVPDLPAGQKPPRFYWRGRIYDHFSGDQWFTTGTTREPYTPLNQILNIAYVSSNKSSRFLFDIGEQKFSLLYAPSQAVWFSRPGSVLSSPAGVEKEITSWHASPLLLPGEAYQVDAIVNNPNIQQLRAAGTAYPEWVTDKYLQLPGKFSTRIAGLAKEITATAETPYDKAGAITRYLRENIEYAPTVPAAPRNTDPLEWILFVHKQAYCVYYASAEVLMLRSVGIPARLAVGFAQGTGTSTSVGFAQEAENILTNVYTVRKNNAHAWPEVYFPEVGWVEFEPTGNQAPLDRPLAPRDNTDENLLTSPNSPLNRDDRLETPPIDPSNNPLDAAKPSGSFLRLIYLVPILIALAALGYFLNRRYTLSSRFPSLVRSTIERGGGEAPGWVVRWDRWGKLSAIERAFESINTGLRTMETPPPIHATPAERADNFVSLLPNTGPTIKILLDEHQTYLYTSRPADVERARRAAFTLRTQVLLARIRHFWTGSYSLKM